MKLIILAMLIATGVFFGILALVVDMGYGMGQQGVMQNAADAGVLSAAKLMAESVSKDASGKAVYALSDNQIYQRALDLANDNYIGNLASSSRVIAVQYLACPGQTDGLPNFAAASDPTLVTDLVASGAVPANSTRLSSANADTFGVGASPTWNWSSPICSVRVWARDSHNGIFASTFSSRPESELAKATARIYPTSVPKTISNVWPITHCDNSADCTTDKPCPDTFGSLCTFWDPNEGVNGSFKQVIDFSRYSQLAINAKPSIPTRPSLVGQLTSSAWSNVLSNQPLYCPSSSTTPCWDNRVVADSASGKPISLAGNNGKLTDVPNWVNYGWRGTLYVDESDSNCSDPTKIVASCQNSRLELYSGDMGNNIGTQMDNYITANSLGNDPSCGGCAYADLNVFFWKYGEQNISMSTDKGTVWGASATDNGNNLQRIIVSRARRFRFNTQIASSNSVQGYFVSFYNPDGTLQDGPPSNVANLVALTG